MDVFSPEMKLCGAFLALYLLTPPHGVLTTPRVPPCATNAKHSRWSMKNRPFVNRSIDAGSEEDYEVTIVETTVDEILARTVPPPAVDVEDQPQDDFEQTLWHMPAYACMVKQETDCDLHLEVAATPATCLTGPRMLVELPATYGREMQETLLDAVGVRLLGRRARHFLPTNTPAIQVFGYGFYDYEHRCAADPLHGCQHGSTLVGTLAELHPARVEAR